MMWLYIEVCDISRVVVYRVWWYIKRRYIGFGGILRLALYRKAVYRVWWYIERRYIEFGGISRLAVYEVWWYMEGWYMKFGGSWKLSWSWSESILVEWQLSVTGRSQMWNPCFPPGGATSWQSHSPCLTLSHHVSLCPQPDRLLIPSVHTFTYHRPCICLCDVCRCFIKKTVVYKKPIFLSSSIVYMMFDICGSFVAVGFQL